YSKQTTKLFFVSSRRRHTRFSRDWSSDVCSSDLADDLLEIENVVIATPTDRAIADKVMEEVKNNYKGELIQILTDDRHEDLANYVSSQLKKNISGAEVSITKDANQLEQKSRAVEEKLSDGTIVTQEYFTPVITILVSDNNNL